MFRYYKELFLLILTLTTIATFISLLIVNPSIIITALDTLHKLVEENQVRSAFIISLFVIVCCFPPMVGYTVIILFAGYCYPIWLAFLLVYPATILGASLCFLLSRLMFSDSLDNVAVRYPKIIVLGDAIEKKGIKMLILIRLAPYPFSLMNLLLATTKITYLKFLIATCVANVKILLNIVLASQFTSIEQVVKGQGENWRVQVVVLMVYVLLIVLSNLYFWITVRNMLKEIDNHGEETEMLEIEVPTNPVK